MKKALLIFGIIAIVAAVIVLIMAVLYMSAYRGAYDGSPELYDSLHRKMIISFIIGVPLLALGAVLLLIKAKA